MPSSTDEEYKSTYKRLSAGIWGQWGTACNSARYGAKASEGNSKEAGIEFARADERDGGAERGHYSAADGTWQRLGGLVAARLLTGQQADVQGFLSRLSVPANSCQKRVWTGKRLIW